jgi:hypothetical protein
MSKTAFWSDPNLEPKRSHRWILKLGGIPSWLIQKVKKPEFELGEAVANYINYEFYFPGRLKWSPVDITLLDPVTPDASRSMQDIIQAAGYHYPEDSSDTTSVSKKNATRALGNVEITQLDADGQEIEKWTLINAWLKKVSYGELDYTKEDMVQITINLRYDYAKIWSANEGVPPASA